MTDRLTKFNEETGEYEYKERAKTQAEFNAQRKAVIQRLGELEDRAEGVIVPPCYIGQEIWHITKHYDGRIEIIKGKVSMLQQKSDKSWKIRITVNSSVWDFTPNEIGTKYFLTREEAEKALERSENGKS